MIIIIIMKIITIIVIMLISIIIINSNNNNNDSNNNRILAFSIIYTYYLGLPISTICSTDTNNVNLFCKSSNRH